MKVIVRIKRSPEQFILVRLPDKPLVDEIRKLINRNRHGKAIVTALSRGTVERELLSDELLTAEADLILSEKNAFWGCGK
ncbi:MAG: hypothetical protein ABH885_04600 [Candidatus Omnitrophota bacterium]